MILYRTIKCLDNFQNKRYEKYLTKKNSKFSSNLISMPINNVLLFCKY